MVARPTAPTRSANAGEFSPDAKGRVDIKQYYSAGLAYKNIEPVPQSGFRQMGGSWHMGPWRKPLVDRAITSPSTSAGPHTGTQTIWSGTVAGAVAGVLLTSLAISAGTATFDIEALVSGVWTKIAGPFAVATGTAVTRFAAFAPGAQKTATSLRVRATFSTSATVTIGSVAAVQESGTAVRPRLIDLTTDAGDTLMAMASEGIVDFFTDAGFVGAARVPALTAAMLPDLDDYAESATIGLFHGDLETQRLLLMVPGQLHDWRQDLWPYDPVPDADLGADYTKTDDVWDVFLRWTNNPEVYMTLTVNGESTPAIVLGLPTGIDVATGPTFTGWAAALATAMEALPSLGPTISSSATDVGGDNTYKLTFTFGGALAGEEYELSAIIVNTTDASALPVHVTIGDTELEPLFSSTRGWPGAAGLVQDRFGYARIKALTGALALSRVAEYFDVNIDGVTDAAARLDRLRSQTTEVILAFKEGSYLLVFTNLGVYFVTNRTIERNTPLNFVLASEIGAQPNCRPFDLEGKVYYVAINPKGLQNADAGGQQLLSVSESAVTSSTSFEAAPESLLASHLVEQVIRTARQQAQGDLDASKGWLMRADGRLVAAQIIKNQEITGYCEWVAASSGAVREIRVDGQNRLWLAVDRAGVTSYELYDTSIFLQDALEATTDLAGRVSGLEIFEGSAVWAVADGYVLGPFTVTGGAIDLEDPYDAVIVGRWQAPRWESMPQVYVTPGDEVVQRPGRIHTANLNIVDTTSIAIGANGETPEDVPLLTATDPTDQPMAGKTQLLTVTGLPGFAETPTLVVTQTRPGRLRVRDLSIGAKL